MRHFSFWWIILAVMLLVDIYVFFATRYLFNQENSRGRMLYTLLYWLVTAVAMVLVILLPYLQFQRQNGIIRSTLFALVFALYFGKIIAVFFFLSDDLRRIGQWVFLKIFPVRQEVAGQAGTAGDGISRSAFLTWMGMIAGGSLFTTFVYGLSNKYNYHVRRVRLHYANLPASFKGLRIVQISDIHSGSFTNKAAVNKGIDKILHEKPDLILFTGDLVNNRADEMNDFKDIFSRVQAPMGVFSILGNHDYGDYSNWETHEAKAANLEKLKSVHGELGWRLMLDEHLPLRRGDAEIGLVGVQNISGRSGFHSYGSMSKAMNGAGDYPFRILMSHDPSHWDQEVITKYKDIDLTLSGHTHGMQFGVEIPGFRWSPVQYVYKRWAGLYEVGHQKLYVNRGFGFIGYPGRVGILPEITVIELV
jgi:predicted MPP superfamily phosphohydrolase